MKRKPTTPPFSPLTHHTREQDDATLTAYLHDRLGMTNDAIKNITTMLGCDGASHEVWEELVARRRSAGS